MDNFERQKIAEQLAMEVGGDAAEITTKIAIFM